MKWTFKLLLLVASVLAVGLGALSYSERADVKPFVERALSGERSYFSSDPLPLSSMLQIYDLGIVDANGDGHLDIFSSNHNYRQYLWLADGKGGYSDSLSKRGLDQSASLPGAEQSMTEPVVDKPGLYIYWRGDVLHLRAHRLEEIGALKGSLQIFNMAEVLLEQGFQVKNTAGNPIPNGIPESRLEFAAPGSGNLALYISTRGTPLSFRIESPWAKSHVYVGTQRVVPASEQFELTLRDRHGMAWSDLNDDGQPDVYVTRGALGGTLRKFPPRVRNQVADEMLVSAVGTERFEELARESGFSKNDCSGRHVRWVDFNHDGLLDLYINCQDRGHVAGGYPKQLYVQDKIHHFTDVAAAVGLDLPDRHLVDFAWFDADGDGLSDLLTHEDDGFSLYLNRSGKFERKFICRGAFERADTKGLSGNTDDYWQFDGKLSVADFDADGDLDIFVGSKKGNTLLVNDNGHFKCADPIAFGLPKASVAATWVDYDNDGGMDLHTVPEGLFRQSPDGRFAATGYFSMSTDRYQAAFIHWLDRDNDGKRDVLMALQENASLWRWWQRPFRSKNVKGEDDRFSWALMPYRNAGAKAHWLQMELKGTAGNREAIGAQVTLLAAGKRFTQQVGASESSYFSQGHYRLYFGLGSNDKADRIEIRWPDGHLQVLSDVKSDQMLKVARDALQ